MFKNNLFILTILIPATNSFSVIVEEKSLVGAKLKIDELLQIAKNQNPELKAARAEIDAAISAIKPSGALEDPMISIEAMSMPVNDLSLNQSEMSGLKVAISQKIPFPGKLPLMENLSKTQSSLAEAQLQIKELEIIRNIKKTYYELYLSYQKQEILENQRTLLQQVLASSRTQYTLNKIPQAAILNLQLEEANLIDEGLQIASRIKDQQFELAHLLGHSHKNTKGRPILIKRTKLDFTNLSEDRIRNAISSSNPEIQAIKLELEASAEKISLAERSYYPDIELMANYTFRQAVRTEMARSDGQDLVGFGVGFSLPIWAGQKQSEEVKGAIADKSKASAKFEHTVLKITHEALATFARLIEIQRRIDLFENGLLQLTKQAVASGITSYLAGTFNQTSVVEALRTQQNTSYSYQEALANFEIQLAELEALIGKNLEFGSL